MLTVCLLDGPRAPMLLSGLCEVVRPFALGQLERLERCSRSERHARLAAVVAARPVLLAAAENIPGPLGAEAREALVRGASRELAWGDSANARWAGRILLELDDG